MKLVPNYCNHESIAGPKFESGSSSSFGDMTEISLRRRQKVIKFVYLPSENRFNFQKKSFYVQNRSSRPKIDPPRQFQQFLSR